MGVMIDATMMRRSLHRPVTKSWPSCRKPRVSGAQPGTGDRPEGWLGRCAGRFRAGSNNQSTTGRADPDSRRQSRRDGTSVSGSTMRTETPSSAAPLADEGSRLRVRRVGGDDAMPAEGSGIETEIVTTRPRGPLRDEQGRLGHSVRSRCRKASRRRSGRANFLEKASIVSDAPVRPPVKATSSTPRSSPERSSSERRSKHHLVAESGPPPLTRLCDQRSLAARASVSERRRRG